MYLLNTNLDETRSLRRSLSALYGIGPKRARQVCEHLGISETIRLDKLSPSQKELLTHLLQQDGDLGLSLKSKIRHHQQRLKTISSARGIRQSQGLPSRGQRTHGNAKTARKQF